MKKHFSHGAPVNQRVENIFSDHGELSDRLWLWWEKNKALTAGCIGAVIVGIALFQAFHYWKRVSFEKMQSSFLQAYESSTFAQFAGEYEGKPLSGIAALLEGDALWKKGELEKACKYYAQASKDFEGLPLAYRAQLGRAVGLIKLGKIEEGAVLLASLSSDPSAPAPFRAQAAYELAQMAYDRGDFAACKTHLELIFTLDAPIWASKAGTLEAFIPQEN